MSMILILSLILSFPALAQDWQASSNPPTLLAAPLTHDAMGVSVHRLSNGLTIYLSPNDQEPRIAAWIAVRAGGAQDPEDSTGMAHYLEHMLFKGSRRLGSVDFAKEKEHLDKIRALYEELFAVQDPVQREAIYAKIDVENAAASRYAVPSELDKAYKQLGVTGTNAFTAEEQTVYICDIPKNRLAAWAKLEGDRFKQPVFRLFQSEIETVYEEKNRSLDNAGHILNEALQKALHKDHPYGRPIIGSIEHLKNPSLEKMYAFYERYYRPNNMAVALAGDFDRQEVLRILEKEFGSWEPAPLPPRPALAPEPLSRAERVEVFYESEEQAILAWPTVPEGDPDQESLIVMDMLLDNSEAGLINLRLNQAQKVKRAGSYPSFSNLAGSWQAWVLPKDGQSLEEAESLLLETIAAVAKGEFSQEDLAAIVLDFEIGEKGKLESNEARVAAMVGSFASYQEWERKVDFLRRLRAVRKEDVVRVANAYLGEKRVSALRRKGKPEIPSIQKPSFTKIEIDASRETPFYREIVSMPAQPITPKWVVEGRDYKVHKTDAGPLYRVQNPMNDLFSLSFDFERGSRHERLLCAALELWDLAGAGELDAEALRRTLYAKGLKMSAYCGEDSSGVSLSGIESGLDEGLRLLRERFEKPNLKADDLEKMVQIWIGQHKDNKIDPKAVASALSSYAKRGTKSPVLAELTDQELLDLETEDLSALLSGVFAFERRMSFVGTVPAPKLIKAAAWGAKKGQFRRKPPREPLRYVRPGADRVLFTHRDMVQAQVGVIAPDSLFDPEKALDYRFYAEYMGGDMSAVIFQEIREARALAYSASGGYKMGARREDENLIWGGLGCQADKTIEATRLLTSLLRGFPSSATRFEETRKGIVESYRSSPITFRGVAGAVMSWEDQGLKKDPRPQRLALAESYPLSRLESFASGWKDRAMTIHVLGSRERVDMAGLKALGEFTEKNVDELFPY